MDHHIDYSAPSIESDTILEECVCECCDVCGDLVAFRVAIVIEDGFVESQMSSGGRRGCSFVPMLEEALKIAVCDTEWNFFA